MVTVTHLAKQFGGQSLFVEVNAQFDAGNRYGIVGANGSGKSTLLRIIAGQETASEGTVTIPKKATVGVLEQDHFRYEDTPIIHVVMAGHSEVWAAFTRKEKMLEVRRVQVRRCRGDHPPPQRLRARVQGGRDPRGHADPHERSL